MKQLKEESEMTIADRIIEMFAICFVLAAVFGCCVYVGWMLGSIIKSVVTW